ncbi:MAG: GNAT family N-acetyltransferase [Candidatus Binatia bacterium]
MIELAESDAEIARCFRVMHQLRPDLDEASFVATVRRQQSSGYRLAFLAEKQEVRAVAGFRLLENLVSGRLLYVDDLVTDEARRSQGHGKALFEWLVRSAREQGCLYLELDSGVQRFAAHRFYLTNRMIIAAHHFRLKL